MKRFFKAAAILAVFYFLLVAFWGAIRLMSCENDSLERCDAIVIFFCAFNDSRSDIDKDTYRRINHAVDLYKNSIASYIICVGGARHKEKLYGSLMMKEALINKGISAESIYTEKTSNDSKSNCRMTYQIADENAWDEICLVSSPLHVYRLRKIMKKYEDIESYGYSYSYADCEPEISFYELCNFVHKEWIAQIANMILPEKIYRFLIDILRG